MGLKVEGAANKTSREFAILGNRDTVSRMTRDDVDFFAPREKQAWMLRRLPAKELSALEQDLRRTPPYSPDSPLMRMVVRERERRATTPKMWLSLRRMIDALTGLGRD